MTFYPWAPAAGGVTVRPPSLSLATVAAVCARIAAIEPFLAVGGAQIAEVSARIPLTRLRISTPDHRAAQDLAASLGLSTTRDGQPGEPAWTGHLTYPSQAPTARALRIDLKVEGDQSTPSITLLEASELLDLLGGAVGTRLAVVRLHLSPQFDADPEVEIHTIGPSDAHALTAETTRLGLPLRVAVHAALMP